MSKMPPPPPPQRPFPTGMPRLTAKGVMLFFTCYAGILAMLLYMIAAR